MALVNLTPHPVVLQQNGHRVVLPSQGCARVRQEYHYVGLADGWLVHQPETKEIEGLPDPQDGIWYVVSAIVLNHADRDDCLAPDTGAGSAVRDANGNIVAVTGFVSRKRGCP